MSELFDDIEEPAARRPLQHVVVRLHLDGRMPGVKVEDVVDRRADADVEFHVGDVANFDSNDRRSLQSRRRD